MQTRFGHRFSRDFAQIQTLLYLLSPVLSKAKVAKWIAHFLELNGTLTTGTHAHNDMEIVSYVLSGALEHKDSMGNGAVLTRGEFQHITAGTGITHSEFNSSDSQTTRFLTTSLRRSLNCEVYCIFRIVDSHTILLAIVKKNLGAQSHCIVCSDKDSNTAFRFRQQQELQNVRGTNTFAQIGWPNFR